MDFLYHQDHNLRLFTHLTCYYYVFFNVMFLSYIILNVMELTLGLRCIDAWNVAIVDVHVFLQLIYSFIGTAKRARVCLKIEYIICILSSDHLIK